MRNLIVCAAIILLITMGCSSNKPSEQTQTASPQASTADVSPHPEDTGVSDPHTHAAAPSEMPGHPPVNTSDIAAPKAGEIKKTDSGNISEIYAKSASLGGKKISVRGKVMKFSANIMGKNWIHVQDGSGDQTKGTHDLTATTKETVKAGDLVLITGKLAKDKDIGAGYFYKVLVEDATVKVEK